MLLHAAYGTLHVEQEYMVVRRINIPHTPHIHPATTKHIIVKELEIPYDYVPPAAPARQASK